MASRACLIGFVLLAAALTPVVSLAGGKKPALQRDGAPAVSKDVASKAPAQSKSLLSKLFSRRSDAEVALETDDGESPKLSLIQRGGLKLSKSQKQRAEDAIASRMLKVKCHSMEL
mmetsp:Transcript_23887/g.68339  ORF Transcript_23887/g.68339 Transcript_23887/m.68339 type:complete len:116 (-) Transcript_23887:63-410(-)